MLAETGDDEGAAAALQPHRRSWRRRKSA
jgi:hypothetical protein